MSTSALDLQNKIRSAIPLSEAMQLCIEEISLDAIRVSAPLSPNINIHGTGFAGSLYSLGILTGWALSTHIISEAGLSAELVVGKAEIRYQSPVQDDISAVSRITELERESFLEKLKQAGKAKLVLDIIIGDKQNVTLQGIFFAKLG